MSDQRDPVDILRDHNPADPRQIDPYSSTANAILARVVATPTRRRVRVRMVAVVAGVVALLVAAAWAVLVTREVTNLSVTCYQRFDLASDRVGLSLDTVPTVSACDHVWLDGTFVVEGAESGTIPPLIGCVTDRGGLAVFPVENSNTCEQLGLATFTSHQPTEPLATVGAIKSEIFDYLDAARCQPIDDAEHVIREILDRHGFIEWRIDRQPDYPGRPCAGVSYDIENETIVLVPDTPR